MSPSIESFLEHLIRAPEGTLWRKSPNDARALMAQFPDFTFVYVEWVKYAWPGCYPIYYICQDGEAMCSKCANANFELTTDPDAGRDWFIVAGDINYEDNDLWCANCNEKIESAYGEEEDDFDDSMDGDAGSALASAGFGTDEDYGGGDDRL